MILSVNLSSEVLDKLKIYRENFEKAYLEATEEFYKTQAAAYLQENGVQNYMKYVRMIIHVNTFAVDYSTFHDLILLQILKGIFLQYMLKNVGFKNNIIVRVG